MIVAAGRSERMGGDDKLWTPLAGPDGRARPLVAYALVAFQRCAAVSSIVLVVAADAMERAETLLRDAAFDKVRAVVRGGARRQDSVSAGIEALGSAEWVVVHDGARPLVTPELIERGIEAAQETGAACCALTVSETVKEADASGTIARTVDRSRLWLAQTPQVFRYDLLVQAHRQATEEAPDDAALVEALGVRVRLYAGSPRNIKVTTPEDLALVQALLSSP